MPTHAIPPHTSALFAAILSVLVLAAPASKAQCDATLVARVGPGNAHGTKTLGDRQYVAMGSAGLVVLDRSDPSQPRWIGALDFSGEITRIEGEADVMFVAEGSTVHAVDVASPLQMRVLDSLDLGGSISEFKLRNEVLYAAAGTAGLRIIDVSDPESIGLIATVPTPDAAWQIAVSSSRAYIVSPDFGIIVDISNPAAPVVLNDNAPAGDDVTLAGTRAYVYDRHIYAYDISDPAAPIQLHSFGYPFFHKNNASDFIAGAGGMLYQVTYYPGNSDPDDECTAYEWGHRVTAWDLSEPSAPERVGTSTFGKGRVNGIEATADGVVVALDHEITSLARSGPPLGLDAAFPLSLTGMTTGPGGTLGYMNHRTAYLRQDITGFVVETDDPIRPITRSTGRFAGSLPSVVDRNDGIGVYRSSVEWDITHCDSQQSGVFGLVDLSDGSRIEQLIVLDYDFALDAAFVGPIVHAFPAGAALRLYNFDTTNPFDPELIAIHEFPGIDPSRIAAEGEFVYLTGQPTALTVIDASDALNPSIVATVPLPFASPREPYLFGEVAIVSGETGAAFIDITDPSAPRLGAVMNFGQYPAAWSYDEGLVVITVSDRAWIVDTSRVSSPRVLAEFPIAFDQNGITGGAFGVQEGLLLAQIEAGLSVFDITGDATTAILAQAPLTSGSAFGVTPSGGFVFLSTLESGVRVIDVADPSSPSEVGSYESTAASYATAVVEDAASRLVYVADGVNGLTILDATIPSSPVPIGSFATSDLAVDVRVEGDFAYVATRFTGLQVIDISNPATPTLVGSVDTPGNAQGVAMVGNTIYIADGTEGVQVIDVSNRSAPIIVGAYDTPQSARAVVVRGLIAYVPDRSGGLIALDVSEPVQPRLMGSIGGIGDARSVTVWGSLAFVADFEGRVKTVDITHPVDMRIVRSVPSLGTPRAIASDGRTLFLADGDAGLSVFEARPCWFRACPADLNDDTLLDFFDLQVFLNAYASGDGLADWNDDGNLDFFDLLGFLGSFADGCP